MKFPSLNEQMDVIRQNAVDLLPEEELVKKIENSIKTNKRLIIKLGADPSRPDLHIGHAVVLRKMRQFQDLGHKAILIIGDFTAMIGDPTGKSKTRPQLTLEDTRTNGESYITQASLVLNTADKEQFEVVYNSDWLNKMNFADVISLAAKYTVAQILERDDFAKRYKESSPISMHELLYPLAQAMDSAQIKSDVELGGTDQKFNLLVGREVQRAYNQEPQVILTMPILEGTDGVEKMSKSLDNYIGLTDTPRDIFGKVMSIPDNLILKYLQYGAYANSKELNEWKESKKAENDPRNAKVEVAIRIVDMYHELGSGQSAFEEFERIFKNKDVPDVIEELILSKEQLDSNQLVKILVVSGLCASGKDAKRLIEQGGVYIDSEKATDFSQEVDLSDFRLFKVGKRKFLKVKLG
jgi:tyrosyl-tRNA synthetase